ncbi:VWA domain-containing protein [Nakamurella silvestris]|nr:VWA domain-containing protein [Nakamurella silvestris]
MLDLCCRRTSAWVVAVVLLALVPVGWGAGASAQASPPLAPATIVVGAAGDRSADGVGVLAGVGFGAYQADGPDDLAAAGPPMATCVTGPDGTCAMKVPVKVDQPSYYTVAAMDAPAGWHALQNWGAPSDVYRFNTGALGAQDAGQVVSLPPDGRSWPTVRDDPPTPAQCGIDVGLVIDLSGSVTKDPALFEQYRNAASQFVHALAGTPSRVSAYTFATSAGVDAPLPPTALSTAGGVQAADVWIAGLTPSADNATNWDLGLRQVTASGDIPDVVLFLTDGDPNRYGDPPVGDGTKLHLPDLEQAIASANGLKAAGSRVVAVGIGGSVDGADGQHRLSLISGPKAGTDYVNTSFDALADTLRQLGAANCAGTLTVVKQVRDSVTGQLTPAGGWQFDVTSAPADAPGKNAEPALLTTQDTTGAANVVVDFADLSQTRIVTVTERQTSGYQLEPQAGHNAICTSDGVELPVTDDGLGFTVELKALQTVSCQVINRELAPAAKVTVEKHWSINGVSYDNGDQPDGFSAALTVSSPSTGEQTTSAPVDWGHPLTGWSVGDTITIGEKVHLPTGCTQEVTGAGPQPVDRQDAVLIVVNRVTCDPGGGMTIAKTFRSAVPTGEQGIYLLTYDISVQNDGSTAGRYRLMDNWGMATDVQVLSAEVSSEDADPATGVRSDFDGSGQPEIAADVSIAAGATQHYLVTARVKVPGAGSTAGACTGAPGSGFFNRATLVPQGAAPLSAQACGPIPAGPGPQPAGRVQPVPRSTVINTLSRSDDRSLAYTGAPISAPLTIGLVLVLIGFLLLTFAAARTGSRRRTE